MPIYEYECKKCGERFELFLRSNAQGCCGPTCPNCGSTEVHKALSLFGLGGGSTKAAASDMSCGPGPV